MNTTQISNEAMAVAKAEKSNFCADGYYVQQTIDAATLDGLRYASAIVAGRRALKRPAAYLAALDDLEIFLNAAIERVESGGPMQAEVECSSL